MPTLTPNEIIYLQAGGNSVLESKLFKQYEQTVLLEHMLDHAVTWILEEAVEFHSGWTYTEVMDELRQRALNDTEAPDATIE